MTNFNSNRVIVTGSLAFDHIMDFPQTFEENIIPEKIKALSVSFLANNFSKNFGGVAGNIAYNLALLRHPVTILSSAGERDFGSYHSHLKKVGVMTEDINQIKGEFTANMFMITDKNNCQIAGFYPGAMNTDCKLSIETLKRISGQSFLVIAPTVPQAMDNFIKEAKKLSVSYLFDPAQQIPRLSCDQLERGISGAEILIGNDYEFALISKKTGLAKKEILARVKVLITTYGDRGSLIETKKQKIKVGIVKPERLVDPTGAGDAYIAGFLKGYLRGLPLKVCGQVAATIATYTIENYGTQKHTFNHTQFQTRYRKAFKKAVEL